MLLDEIFNGMLLQRKDCPQSLPSFTSESDVMFLTSMDSGAKYKAIPFTVTMRCLTNSLCDFMEILQLFSLGVQQRVAQTHQLDCHFSPTLCSSLSAGGTVIFPWQNIVPISGLVPKMTALSRSIQISLIGIPAFFRTSTPIFQTSSAPASQIGRSRM